MNDKTTESETREIVSYSGVEVKIGDQTGGIYGENYALLNPSEALRLLEWLTQEKSTLKEYVEVYQRQQEERVKELEQSRIEQRQREQEALSHQQQYQANEQVYKQRLVDDLMQLTGGFAGESSDEQDA